MSEVARSVPKSTVDPYISNQQLKLNVRNKQDNLQWQQQGKYLLDINLTLQYAKNYKILKKEIKEHLNKRRDFDG